MINLTCKTKSAYLRGHPDGLASEIALKIEDEYSSLSSNSFANVKVVGGLGVLIVSGEVYSSNKLNHKEIALSIIRDLGLEENFIFLDNIILLDPGLYIKEVKSAREVGNARHLLELIKNSYDKITKVDSRFLPDGKVSIEYSCENDLLYVSSLTIQYNHVCRLDKTEANSIVDRKITELALENSIHIEKIEFLPECLSNKLGFSRRAGSSELT